MWLDESSSKNQLKSHNINRICFIGDSTSPEVVFKNGFKPKKAATLIFSPCFKAATLYPFDENIDSTWIYLFYAKKGYEIKSTPAFQTLTLTEITTRRIESSDIIAAVKVTRFGDNTLTNHLPAYINKDLNSDTLQALEHFFKKRGQFLIEEHLINPNCTLSRETQELAKWYIQREKVALQTTHPKHQFSMGAVIPSDAKNDPKELTKDGQKPTNYG